MLRDQIPSLYNQALPAELLEAPVLEQKAICAKCTKAEPGEAKPFRADLKCCTYHPYLPNYLVGSLLATKESLPTFARERLENKILQREYALPVGMLAPLSLQIPFSQRLPEEFGNREDWLCPYYNKADQNCGIWQNRNSTCITYFCKSSYALEGQKFWISLKDYLHHIEISWARHAALELGISESSIEQGFRYLSRREGSAKERYFPELEEARSQELWEKHYDTQEEFFIDTYSVVQSLGSLEHFKVLGAEGEVKKIRCLEDLRKLSFSL